MLLDSVFWVSNCHGGLIMSSYAFHCFLIYSIVKYGNGVLLLVVVHCRNLEAYLDWVGLERKAKFCSLCLENLDKADTWEKQLLLALVLWECYQFFCTRGMNLLMFWVFSFRSMVWTKQQPTGWKRFALLILSKLQHERDAIPSWYGSRVAPDVADVWALGHRSNFTTVAGDHVSKHFPLIF